MPRITVSPLPYPNPLPSLSRKDCDLNAIKAGMVGALTNKADQETIRQEIEALRRVWLGKGCLKMATCCLLCPIMCPAIQPMFSRPRPFRADQPEAVREKQVQALINGFASHHAGHLPGWKALIERLFQRGLCKIVGGYVHGDYLWCLIVHIIVQMPHLYSWFECNSPRQPAALLEVHLNEITTK